MHTQCTQITPVVISMCMHVCTFTHCVCLPRILDPTITSWILGILCSDPGGHWLGGPLCCHVYSDMTSSVFLCVSMCGLSGHMCTYPTHDVVGLHK